MTPIDDQTPPERRDDALVLGGLELTSAELNGHTIDELADYYDAGLTPPDPSIDDSAGCQIALAAIARLRALTAQLADDDEASQPAIDEGWVSGILNQISLQARAGRDIPLLDADERAGRADASPELVITEGAVRAIVRAAGDRVDGLFIGRCRMVGDVTVPGAPVVLEVDASVLWGQSIVQTAQAVRQAILADLARHTRLNVVAVNVTVHDVQPAVPDARAEREGKADV